MDTVLILGTVAIPLLGAGLGALAQSLAHKRLLSGLALLNLAVAAVLAVQATRGAPTSLSGPWGLTLAADRLGGLLVLLAAGIQATVLPYAARCLEGRAFRRFAATSQVLVATMSLTGTAATLGTLVLGWVAASVAVYALVAGTGPPRRAAWRLGGAFLLGDGALVGSLIIVRRVLGDPFLSQLAEAEAHLSGVRIPLGPAVLTPAEVVAVLVVLAASVRCALWPGPRWLPSTLAAPTPGGACIPALVRTRPGCGRPGSGDHTHRPARRRAMDQRPVLLFFRGARGVRGRGQDPPQPRRRDRGALR